MHDILISTLIIRIHEKVTSTDGPLAAIYGDFRRETNELFDTPEQLHDFIREEGVAEKYRSGELGNNEQLMYSALVIFRHMKEVHEIAYEVAGELLRESGVYEDWIGDYLSELVEFSLLRKQDMLVTKKTLDRRFHYDFIAINDDDFIGDPRDYLRQQEVPIRFRHNDDQKELVEGYLKVYGETSSGLGHILGLGKNVRNFYRRIETVSQVEKQAVASSALSELS
jgi:hypothetical protein